MKINQKKSPTMRKKKSIRERSIEEEIISWQEGTGWIRGNISRIIGEVFFIYVMNE